MSMTLTNDQQNALEAFERFLSTDDQVFLLKGSAGTGKTTLMKMLVELIPGISAHLMAPTGRAAMILGEKLKREANTIHSSIYCFDKDLYEDEEGKLYFDLKMNADPTNDIYFVDESSMVSDRYMENDTFRFGSGRLLSDLLKYCGNRKIVFVGDYAQLPPVGQSISPALDAEYLTKEYNKSVQEVMLREVVRQDNESGVYVNATRVRDCIEGKDFNTFNIVDASDVMTSQGLLEDYLKNFDKDNLYKNLLVAYTNQQVMNYNVNIRQRIFEKPERLCIGDILVVSKNNHAQGEHSLFNGQIVKVKNCDGDSSVEIRTIGFTTREDGKTVPKQMTLAFREVTLVTPEGKELNCLILDNYLDDDSINDRYLNQALMVDFKKRMKELDYGPEEYKDEIRRDKYVNAVLCRYGYAITCHKAQGGEWENVYVDFGCFSSNANSTFFRWAYTAITRSSKRLWHFSSPQFNAISKLKYQPIIKGGSASIAIPQGMDVKAWRMMKLESLCNHSDIKCIELLNQSYQHKIGFERSSDSCVVMLWLNKDGYTGRFDKVRCNNDDFYTEVMGLLDDSFIPDSVDYSPANDSARLLHDHITSMAKELGICITNICQEPWKDKYYFKTDAASNISFLYNSKGIYSTAIPQSIMGDEDLKLKELCEKLQ